MALYNTHLRLFINTGRLKIRNLNNRIKVSFELHIQQASALGNVYMGRKHFFGAGTPKVRG